MLVLLAACTQSVTRPDPDAEALDAGASDAADTSPMPDDAALDDGGTDAAVPCSRAAPTFTGVTVLGGSGLEHVTAVSPDPIDGAFFVAGDFDGDAFGTSPPATLADGFHLTLRASASGVTTSALRAYASSGGSELADAYVDTHGSVTLGGTLHGGTGAIERTSIDSGTSADTGLVVRLVTGMAPSILLLAPVGGLARVNAVSRRGDGYLVAGELEGTLTIGSETCTASDHDAFVAAFTFEGTIDWLRCFGGPGVQRARGVAIQNAGDVYVVGDFTSAISLDGASSVMARGASDAFVARFDGTGTPVWLQSIGTPDAAREERLVRVVISGSRVLAVGTLGEGETGLTVDDPPRGGADGALVVLDTTSAEVLRVARYGGSSEDALTDVAVDRCGQAWIVGDAENTYGRGLLETFDAATLAPGVTPVRDARDVILPSAVGVSTDGASIVVAGTYVGTPTIAGTALPAVMGPSDVFVTMIAR